MISVGKDGAGDESIVGDASGKWSLRVWRVMYKYESGSDGVFSITCVRRGRSKPAFVSFRNYPGVSAKLKQCHRGALKRQPRLCITERDVKGIMSLNGQWQDVVRLCSVDVNRIFF